jgi:hypothetical protein
MKTTRLLYLSAHNMTAYRWKSGEVTSENQFDATPDGYQQFAAYLAQHSRSVFSVLANVSEEGFQIETVPFLRGADRQAVIRRKLAQLFFNSPLTASLSLGYEKSRRKDERILLAALTNAAFFAPWIEAIGHAGVALAGVYSLPTLAGSLLKKLQIADEHCLLLTVQDQSIRQSYFAKGELHFSRLTPLHNSSIGGIAQTLAAEATKLQQYLASQRLIARGQAIKAHILAHSNALKTLLATCVDTATIHYNILSIEDCATRTGLKSALADSHSQQLFLNLLATTPPRIQFADDGLRHDYHLGQVRSALNGIGALTLIACLLFSGKLLYEGHAVEQEAAALRAETAQLRERYESIVKTFPAIPTDNETLRQVIDRYAALDKRSASPDDLYLAISRALQAAPAAEIDSIDWKMDGADRGTATAGANPQDNAAADAGDGATALVRGTLRLGPEANARQLLTVFDNLVNALKSDPQLRVELLQRPFDIEPGKVLKGGGVQDTGNKQHGFSLQIARRLGS